ncbi:MAG: HAMP domain-containing sensor histidine kinase [Chloroflexi bacterium]|nr:HAMP domain-containing sensor histidine kinase [Chloroflexota bacterium]MDA1226791.1 HAMP domain-containing sensor histidine kinase [Chloroflexota bacterium]
MPKASPERMARIAGLVLLIGGGLFLLFSPLISARVFSSVWSVEPLSYVGALLVIAGLAAIAGSYYIERRFAGQTPDTSNADSVGWSELTQQYFELFDHDLGRPLRRILGKERELRAILRASEGTTNPEIVALLDEIERQAPNFRLMMTNIRVLVQLEAADPPSQPQPVEPAQVVRRIVDRYTQIATDSGKQVVWWAEPSEFGLIYSDSSAIEHVITNLVDNAMRFAESQVEVRLTKNPTHFFIRVWDDGDGISEQYQRHLFDRGWTPEVARREEKVSSGLGLFIARTLARKFDGDLTIESTTSPDPDHHTEFLLSLPLRTD